MNTGGVKKTKTHVIWSEADLKKLTEGVSKNLTPKEILLELPNRTLSSVKQKIFSLARKNSISIPSRRLKVTGSKCNPLTDLQKAYLCGFIDADGTIVAQITVLPNGPLNFGLRLFININQKAQKRRAFLDTLQQEVGLGSVRTQTDKMAYWVISSYKAVGSLLEVITPFLRVKQPQALLLKVIWDKMPLIKNDPTRFLEVAILADAVAKLNDSSVNRIHNGAEIRKSFQDRNLL